MLPETEFSEAQGTIGDKIEVPRIFTRTQHVRVDISRGCGALAYPGEYSGRSPLIFILLYESHKQKITLPTSRFQGHCTRLASELPAPCPRADSRAMYPLAKWIEQKTLRLSQKWDSQLIKLWGKVRDIGWNVLWRRIPYCWSLVPGRRPLATWEFFWAEPGFIKDN